MSSQPIFRIFHLNLRLISANRTLIGQQAWSQSGPAVNRSSGLVQCHHRCSSSSSNNSSPTKKQNVSFASLLRSSPLVQLGLPEGKVAIGNIVDVVGDDLYVDFGFKFNAVCRRPKLNPGSFVRGATVKVRINDLELSDRFLGSTKDMTLLEADVTLLGLVSTPVKSAKSEGLRD